MDPIAHNINLHPNVASEDQHRQTAIDALRKAPQWLLFIPFEQDGVEGQKLVCGCEIDFLIQARLALDDCIPRAVTAIVREDFDE